MLRVAIIGFGGIAKASHLLPYLRLEEEGLVELVAVCDKNPENFEQGAAINIGTVECTLKDTVHRYTDWQELLDKERPDMVDICLPTFLHAPVAKAAFAAGCHVLCEKPMSLSYDLCCEMLEAAKQAGKRLMIGQCLRFAASYLYVKKLVDEGTYGAVKDGTFHRTSPPPLWGADGWFLDGALSGGCVTDMHIHDIDMVRFLFGDPDKISCHTQDMYGPKDISHSTLCYPHFIITATGDWAQEGTEFSAGYCIAFDKATVINNNGRVTVCPRNGDPIQPPMPEEDFYENEIRFFVNSIINDVENTVNPPESAALSVRLVNLLAQSADQDGAYMEVTK